MLVKHCGGKSMPMGDKYLRIACREKEDNDIVVNALKEVISEFTVDG
jgi:histidinol-phosphate/aromatic aminotransferase/cobyric acid decarboxylase-like protein